MDPTVLFFKRGPWSVLGCRWSNHVFGVRVVGAWVEEGLMGKAATVVLIFDAIVLGGRVVMARSSRTPAWPPWWRWIWRDGKKMIQYFV